MREFAYSENSLSKASNLEVANPTNTPQTPLAGSASKFWEPEQRERTVLGNKEIKYANIVYILQCVYLPVTLK